MTTKKTGKGKVNATKRAEDEAKAVAERQAKEMGVAKQLQEVLESNGMALQPFIQFSEYGIVPRVRLVDDERLEMPQLEVNNPEGTNGENDEAADTAEAGGDSEEPQPVDTEQPQSA